VCVKVPREEGEVSGTIRPEKEVRETVPLFGNIVVKIVEVEGGVHEGAGYAEEGVGGAVVKGKGQAAERLPEASEDFGARASEGRDNKGPVRVGNCVMGVDAQRVIIGSLNANETPPGFLEEDDVYS
jgi:hypothetical protein